MKYLREYKKRRMKDKGKYLTQVGFTSDGHAVYAQSGRCSNYGIISVGQHRSKTTNGVRVIVKRYNNHVSVTWINPKYAPFTATLR